MSCPCMQHKNIASLKRQTKKFAGTLGLYMGCCMLQSTNNPEYLIKILDKYFDIEFFENFCCSQNITLLKPEIALNANSLLLDQMSKSKCKHILIPCSSCLFTIYYLASILNLSFLYKLTDLLNFASRYFLNSFVSKLQNKRILFCIGFHNLYTFGSNYYYHILQRFKIFGLHVDIFELLTSYSVKPYFKEIFDDKYIQILKKIASNYDIVINCAINLDIPNSEPIFIFF